MAIRFNSDALRMFSNVDFGRDDAIANLGRRNGLVQNDTRGLGVFAKFRSDETKSNNNAVRTELLKALGRAFYLDGIHEDDGKTTFSADFMDRLETLLGPETFKRDDFGINADGEVKSGRPLTQRRIQAVHSAAVNAAIRLNDAVVTAKSMAANAYVKNKDPRFGSLDSLIESAMKATSGDAALMGLLQKKNVINAILVGGSGIRTEEEVLEKVAALKANVEELRAATKGNRAMFEAGLRGLANLVGKTFARGYITAMVREVSTAKINTIRKLSATSNAEEIHDAVLQYHRILQDVLKKSNVLASFKSVGGAELFDTRDFIGNLLFARCTPAELENMDVAFSSVSATETHHVYDLIQCGRLIKDGLTPEKNAAIKDFGEEMHNSMFYMANNVRDALGKMPIDIGYAEGKPEDYLDLGTYVLADIEELADEHLAEEAANES